MAGSVVTTFFLGYDAPAAFVVLAWFARAAMFSLLMSAVRIVEADFLVFCWWIGVSKLRSWLFRRSYLSAKYSLIGDFYDWRFSATRDEY